jgi:hypothetical protein
VPPPTTPTLPADIFTALDALAAAHPANCEVITLPNKTAAPPGVDVKCVRIHDGAAPKDPAVLVVGGVHAREMAPPDALLRLAQNLLDSFTTNSDISFPALTAMVNQPAPAAPLPISYPAYSIPADKVQKIVKETDVYILPLVNPDGRLYDITNPGTPFASGWRKNRRPNPDSAAAEAIGVDLNRNFDVAWAFDRYYDMPTYSIVYSNGPASTSAEDETFNGVTDPARTVTIVGSPSGGTFTLSFDGSASATIAFDAAASAVETALRALASVGAGNVTVTGPNGGPYAVTFVGARAHPVGMLTADYSGLTGGTDPKVEVTHAGPHSEPETLNVQWLVDNRKIRFFLDVHQAGRSILLPWGLEDNGTDSAMTFQTASWDWRRDGLLAASVPGGRTNYNEFMPNGFPYYLGSKIPEIGAAMQQGILLAAGANPAAAAGADPRKDHSTYKVGSSARFYHPSGGPLTGTSDDYAFSRQFVDASRFPVYSLAMEVGSTDEENGFHPDYTAPNNHYQKIEREVHAAVIEFLTAAARWCRFCVVATAAYGSAAHPDVVFLQTLRDDELRSTRFGARAVAVLERVYYTFSPAAAEFIQRRSRLRAAVRVGVVRPAVVAVRALVRATAPIRPRGLRVAVLATAIACLPIVLLGLLGVGLSFAVRALAGA